MDEQPRHNYLKKIDRMIKKGQLHITTGVSDLYIAHDDWCGINKGSYCNCNPDITIKKRPSPEDN